MTVTTPASPNLPAERPSDLVTVVIDGVAVQVPKGTLVIRAAEQIGIRIPRFCDHPLLDPVGACRQCLVEVEGQRKPLASCTTTVTDGMVVSTQVTSPTADKAQQGVMELLLINHPLDCPVCDKGGECPLQNQAMSNGRAESRFVDVKRTYPKPISISSQVLLDRERCVLCARCTRFSKQIAGDPFIDLIERGALQQVGIYEKQPFESYFSGNTIQICPVGALTSAAYRFRARPFDLVSTPTTCEHCASGCGLRSDFRRGKVLRRLADDVPEVNEEWNCDKGRFAFRSARVGDRLASPLVRDADGVLQPASWPEALAVAAAGLAAARGNAAVLPGGRVTLEDAYAYAKFARVTLGTNDVDARARRIGPGEEAFLATRVAGRDGIDYAALEKAPAVLLVGFEPEEESPIVFLRLRKATRSGRQRVAAVAALASRGLAKLDATLLPTAPGDETAVLQQLAAGDAGLDDTARDVAAALREPGAVILVGERLAQVPGGLAAAAALATATGATLAWVPRRAGERGAVEAGALPSLLPGGRTVTDADARADVASAWGTDVPETPGRSVDAIWQAAAAGQLGALVVGGVEPDDHADPSLVLKALESRAFVVSLEVRESEVTRRADVVLPVAPVEEKSGTFLNWEGRPRPFPAVLASSALSDTRALHVIADEVDAIVAGTALGLPSTEAAAAELEALGRRPSESAGITADEASPAQVPADGQVRLATWRMLLDLGRGQDGEPELAGTAHPVVARISANTAASIGAVDGGSVTVSTEHGSITVPVVVAPMVDGTVWLPTHSAGSRVSADLRAGHGDVVTIAAGGAA